MLDAAAREKLVRQAAGKSTREVQQMLAEVDPELAQPRDRMRALGGGRWELKAAVSAECRLGLEKLQRHLAALRCLGAVQGSRSRYIPVAVKREVWRRDQGRCSYVDSHSGRRCGSRYRLEIDHIVPF